MSVTQASRWKTIVAILALAAMGCGNPSGPRERIETLEIASARVPCSDPSGNHQCLQVRAHTGEPWGRFYDPIEGFNYEPGFEYTIRVAIREIANPPADGSSLAYRLLAVLRKVPAPP